MYLISGIQLDRGQATLHFQQIKRQNVHEYEKCGSEGRHDDDDDDDDSDDGSHTDQPRTKNQEPRDRREAPNGDTFSSLLFA
jgi:hypothetical protein